jgi:hypothetical protein
MIFESYATMYPLMRVLVIVLMLAARLPAADQSPPLETVVDRVRSAVQPDQAMDFMRRVYTTDRWFTFPKFQETADYLKSAMAGIGLKSIEVGQAPADGVSQFGYWTMPLAWDVKQARLEIIDPPVILADYQKIPSSLGMWSGPTPPEGIAAEIVDVKRGSAAEIEKLDLRGKLALVDQNPANIKPLLVKAGAIGAINAFTENPDLPDGRQWINAWGDNGWAFTKASTPLLSFSITPKQAALVRQLLAERGSLRVRATVDSRYYAGTYPYVTGLIPGTTPEEVLTLGHSSEQGAQDNATGVAAMLESLATLNRLIESGKLPKPRRGIRILTMGEMYGSLHYIAKNPERMRRTVAAMCMDTPAASYDLPGTEYTFHLNPMVARSYVDALILRVAQQYFPSVKRPWHSHAFRSGTDSYLGDPTIGVPTVWAYSGSGVETHHNSEDTPDRVDKRSLRDIAIVNASFLYYLANAGEAEAQWLAELTAKSEGGTGFRQAEAVLSVLRLVPEQRREAVRVSLHPLIARLKEDSWSAPDSEAAHMIVKRKRMGTLPLDDLPPDRREGYPSGAWASAPTVALYWCDGRRNLAEVVHLTEMELGPTKFDFMGYFKFLQKYGYVDLIK